MRVLVLVLTFIVSSLALAEDIVFTLTKTENVRVLRKDILETAAILPSGTVISVPKGLQPETHLYRASNGRIENSSNGFLPQVKILAVMPEHERSFTRERIAALNRLGLWMTVMAVPIQTEEDFPALNVGVAQRDYLSSFEENGRPKFFFTSYFQTRFPTRLNLEIDPATQSATERLKWQSIMRELAIASDRTVVTDNAYLFIPFVEADAASRAYEDRNEVVPFGAWTIAVKSTAPRHGFGNVPCAEFVSEIIKQAYKRAGFDVFEDFNEKAKTRLSWDTTSAVVNLTNTLYKVGWIPWELVSFRPPTGAIMAHFKATTPGHVYMAAGHDGRLIVDNGSPGGRQLYRTTDKVIKMMYYGGVFFLPPGIIPSRW